MTDPTSVILIIGAALVGPIQVTNADTPKMECVQNAKFAGGKACTYKVFQTYSSGYGWARTVIHLDERRALLTKTCLRAVSGMNITLEYWGRARGEPLLEGYAGTLRIVCLPTPKGWK